MKGDINISNPSQLWEAFSKLANLRDEAYDKALIDDIYKALGFGSRASLQRAIDRGTVSTESLLSAMLSALQPFSYMLSDLLRLFERIGAKRSDNNLRISFDFGSEEAFHIDLSAFRSDVRVIETATVPCVSLDDPWLLSQRLQKHLRKWAGWHGLERFDFIRDDPSLRDISSWMIKYNNNERTGTLPICPSSGEAQLDKALQTLWSLAAQSLYIYEQILDTHVGRWPSIRLAIEECERREAESTNARASGARIAYLRAEGDDWCGHMVRLVAEIAWRVNHHGKSDKRELATGAARAIQAALDECGTGFQGEMVVQIERLMSVLQLPYWKRRYELYSAWVLTQIDAAIGDLGIRYLIEDGKLSFSFKGVRIAECDMLSPAFSVFAELRSAANNPIGAGRKEAIQPDYTLAIDPPGEPRNAMTVVECKQYKHPSRKNFVEALVDYAYARPQANVLIADYGPAPSNYSSIDGVIKARTEIMGMVRPGTKSAHDLQAKIRNSIVGYYRYVAERRPEYTCPWSGAGEPCVIELRWGASPLDLDLQMTDCRIEEVAKGRGAHVVYYGRPTHHLGREYGSLSTDCRRGNGREVLRIDKWDKGVCDILVSNYSGEEQIDAEASVSLRCGSVQRTAHVSGLWKRGMLWHVFRLLTFGVQVVDEWVNPCFG